MDSGRLNGSIAGGRQDKALYIPDLYAKTQNAWVDSFLAQNGYLGKSCLSGVKCCCGLSVAEWWFESHPGLCASIGFK